MMVIQRNLAASTRIVNSHILPLLCRYSSKSSPSILGDKGSSNQSTSAYNENFGITNNSSRMHNLPLFWGDETQLDKCHIEVIDSEAWSVSSSLAPRSNSVEDLSQSQLFGLEELDGMISHKPKPPEGDPDVDEVEDMRIHGNLFYKIECNSMEFEEYEFDYHGKKLKSRKNDKGESAKKENSACDITPNGQKSLKGKGAHQVISQKQTCENEPLVNKERLAQTIMEKYIVCDPEDHHCMGKRQRSPTFNQLTGPYHEPFCLDIFVSKGSIRACVIHRVTSKVVVVAHSISKDMKFDLGSTKSVKAAVSVGRVLAQRALEDDIHDVIYTPRKGDRLEGKLQVVLQSIMDNGINVKVSLKLRNMRKAVERSTTGMQEEQ